MTTERTQVLVIGAGPVGMTLALTLRKFGAEVTIVDRAERTGLTPRAAVIWARTLEVLDLLGIVDAWKAEGAPLRELTVQIDGTPGRVHFGGVPSPHPEPLGIGQDRTEAALDAALRESGAVYRRGVEVSDLIVGENGASVTLDGETRVEAEWIVGCEGSRSIVREAAGIARQGERHPGLQIVQGDLRLRGPLAIEPGHGYAWAHRIPGDAGESGRMMMILPTSRGGTYRLLVAVPDDGAQGDPTLDELQALARETLPGVTLSDPVWLNRFRVQHQIAERYRAGRAFLVGDAAHVWVPIGAQGMNIGMQDAFDLGWKLAGVATGRIAEAALDTYEAERRPIGAQNIVDSERMFAAILRPRAWGDRALRKLLPLVMGISFVSERVAERFAELDFHYSPDALVAPDAGHRGGVGTGERAPDAYFADADGQTVSLFDLLRKGSWIVLDWRLDRDETAVDLGPFRAFSDVEAYGVDSTPEGIEGETLRLRDLTGRAAAAFGLSRGSVLVIRPDGVIAFRGREEDEGAAARFLAGVLVARL